MNYQELDSLIERLEETVDDSDPQKGYWKELWALASKIGGGFKGTPYQTRAEKDAAWQRFQKLCERAKARSQENRREMEKRKKEWEERNYRSEQTKRRIEGKAYGAGPMSGFERSIADLVLLPITVAERIIGMLLGVQEKSQLEQMREELKGCNEQIRKAWDAFKTHKDDLLPGDRAQCYETLNRAQERITQAWARWKSASDQYYQAKRAAWEHKQREWEERQCNRSERIRANISKLEEKLDKARSALDRQAAHLDKLRDDYRNAWNDSFKDRCSEWIDEAESKIADIKAHIDRLEGWMDEERRKLD